MTYTIAARDPETGAFGLAVQSHFFGVGRLVTWAEAGVGAVATQAFLEVGYGPRGLALMRAGSSAGEALDTLLAEDDDASIRQVAILDSDGRVAVHTGSRCPPVAGSRLSGSACAIGNMLADPSCCPAMIDAYERGNGDFANRLLAALDAGEAAGGDIRGRQSAAVLVVSAERTDRPWENVLLDVRVDDHPDPHHEIRRLADFDRAYRKLGAALFMPGLLTGRFDPGHEQLEHALDDLRDAQEVLGPNAEPSVWRGLILARAGRWAEARRDLGHAVEERPALAEFLRRLVAVDLLPEAAQVTSTSRSTEFGA